MGISNLKTFSCSAAPADGSEVDCSSAEIKLADVGLTKILDQQSATPSLVLSAAVGVMKGTMMYLSPEAFSGSHERSAADDLWSACLVIYEMDTGLSLQGLMNGPGSVNIQALLTKSSPDLLPLLCSVVAAQSAGSRCSSAAELKLLRILDASIDPLFLWHTVL
jgi:serine/threonine protein kinase